VFRNQGVRLERQMVAMLFDDPDGHNNRMFFSRYSRTNFTVMRSITGNGLSCDVEAFGMIADSFQIRLLFKRDGRTVLTVRLPLNSIMAD